MKISVCLIYVLSWPLYRSFDGAASSPGRVCLNMWKGWINETPMAGVIHAQRTTVWTVQASTPTQIPSGLLMCAQRQTGDTSRRTEYCSKHNHHKPKNCRNTQINVTWVSPAPSVTLWPACRDGMSLVFRFIKKKVSTNCKDLKLPLIMTICFYCCEFCVIANWLRSWLFKVICICKYQYAA